MNKVFYGLPENIKFCKSCVISNQRPSSTIEFKHLKNEKKQTIFLMRMVFAMLASIIN